ncbi:hypothetical protein E1200_04465 [Actinomadura sp. GC306]|uniref:hypothetical protein n=1 Tax=Actinomadura sp. GC306 TaxID=2530367 RepID=UPI0010480ED4|nr:hypothetical protein [Actinomadura sp. GC306]TDC70732.1 hypothetical protein E1200_04465 [Actinomadura sp. GC306]
MTSEPAKKPGTRVEPKYEEDLRELFERLLQGAQVAAKPADAPAEAETTEEEAAEEKASDEKAADEKASEEKAGDEKATDDGSGERAGKKTRVLRAGRVRPRRWAVPALAVLAAAAVGASAFFAGRATSEDEDAPRRQVAVRAGEIANALYNYDYRQVDRYLDLQASVMTAKMTEEVRQSRDTISAIITGGKLVWTSRVARVYVADVTASSASVIVELNGKVVNSKGISNLTGTVIRFELARESGRWLVAKAPATLSVGTETATDLDGKPLPPASPSAAPEKE